MRASALLPRVFKRLTPEEREELTIRFPSAVLSFLQEVRDKESTLTVYYAFEQHFFISTIIEAEEERVIIDAPSSLIKPPLSSQESLHVMGYFDQVPFYIVVPSFQRIVHERFPALQFSLPRSLIRLQRRTTFRLMIPMEFSVRAHFLLYGKKIDGRVADISRGGVRVTDLSPEWVSTLKKEQPLILITELEGLRLSLTMSVTHTQVLRYAQGKRTGQVCLRFIDLPKQAEYHIARFLLRHEVLFSRMQ